MVPRHVFVGFDQSVLDPDWHHDLGCKFCEPREEATKNPILQRAARIRANDTLNSNSVNFHCVASLTVKRYAAVFRGPPRPEAVPGLWLQTSVDLAQQGVVHTVLANVLWFHLAKVSPLKLGAQLHFAIRTNWCTPAVHPRSIETQIMCATEAIVSPNEMSTKSRPGTSTWLSRVDLR